MAMTPQQEAEIRALLAKGDALGTAASKQTGVAYAPTYTSAPYTAPSGQATYNNPSNPVVYQPSQPTQPTGPKSIDVQGSFDPATGTWKVQPVVTVDGQKYTFNTPQEYANFLQQHRNINPAQMDPLIAKFNTWQGQWKGGTTPQNGAPASGSSAWDAIAQNDPFIKQLLSDPAKLASFNAMDDTSKSLFIETARSLSKAVEAGKVVNPNIQITPEQLKQFYDQAGTELDPYYAEQYKVLRSDIDLSLGRMTADYNKSVERARDPFRQAVEEQAESEAQSGTAFSSGRKSRLDRTLTGQENYLGDLQQTTERSAQDLVRGYEGFVGSDKARSIALPTLSSFQPGEKAFGAVAPRTINPSLVGGISYGSVGAEQETAKKTRANELESAYRRDRILNYSPLS